MVTTMEKIMRRIVAFNCIATSKDNVGVVRVKMVQFVVVVGFMLFRS
jgi:hypothetical protein